MRLSIYMGAYIAEQRLIFLSKVRKTPEIDCFKAKNNKDGYSIKVTVLFWYTGRDSNPQPSEPESDALSIEPPVHLLYSLNIIAGFFPFVKGYAENIFLNILVLWAESGCFPGVPVV